MIIGKAKDLFDGQDIIDTLTNAGIVVATSSLGAPVPSVDGEGNLHLAIAETDLAQTKVLLKDWLVSK
jgi:hypothetical protein